MNERGTLREIYRTANPIKGLAPYRGKILVFTESAIYELYEPTRIQRIIAWVKGWFGQ